MKLQPCCFVCKSLLREENETFYRVGGWLNAVDSYEEYQGKSICKYCKEYLEKSYFQNLQKQLHLYLDEYKAERFHIKPISSIDAQLFTIEDTLETTGLSPRARELHCLLVNGLSALERELIRYHNSLFCTLL